MSGALTAEARMQPWLAIYLALGEDRSLAKTIERGKEVGAPNPPSQSTIERWSSKYDWKARAAEYDASAVEHSVEFALADALMQDQRHLENSRLLQAVGVARLRPLMELAPDDVAKEVSVADARRLVVDGLKVERLVSGKATERVELTIDSVNAATRAAEGEFRRVLDQIVDDESQLERLFASFAQGLDDAMYRYLAEQNIDLSESPEGELVAGEA